MSYNIGRWPITPEELDSALSGLTANARRESEAEPEAVEISAA